MFGVVCVCQFYQTVNTAGGHPKIEVIYIGLDGEAAEFEDSRQRMPWLSLQYNSPLRHKLIKRYRLKIEPAGQNISCCCCCLCCCCCC